MQKLGPTSSDRLIRKAPGLRSRSASWSDNKPTFAENRRNNTCPLTGQDIPEFNMALLSLMATNRSNTNNNTEYDSETEIDGRPCSPATFDKVLDWCRKNQPYEAIAYNNIASNITGDSEIESSPIQEAPRKATRGRPINQTSDTTRAAKRETNRLAAQRYREKCAAMREQLSKKLVELVDRHKTLVLERATLFAEKTALENAIRKHLLTCRSAVIDSSSLIENRLDFELLFHLKPSASKAAHEITQVGIDITPACTNTTFIPPDTISGENLCPMPAVEEFILPATEPTRDSFTMLSTMFIEASALLANASAGAVKPEEWFSPDDEKLLLQ